ncbi:MAG: hypothetical protein UY01_C0035G0001 [Candidatus Nomurabacteria bacterium GW2011_GWB1_47_6]|uniref:DOD-type homing endonuclease domain-containing protein n=1 Tax=Candidatus Nomurabacteria bacterium GW2011_GWB1_47_6 TaxID=1618749 RepID=A0A0G1VWI4_9BACT|nr:MAG: hypothetical protein UY01_C0035G0001 [Candidatus Nomurabacteria bacterium GW2011_GWB1_47_6]
MAYILGYIFADGSLENSPYIRGKYLRITSTDESSIINLKSILSSKHKIIKTLPDNNHKPDYLLRIGSHKIFNDLKKYGLHPHKSLTMMFPNPPKKYLGDFIRGYFDGDGCIHLERIKGGSIKCVRVIFTSGSIKFLSRLAEILTSRILLTVRKIYKGTRSYQLRYNTRDSEKLFVLMYKNTDGIFMERKFNIFCEYLKSKPNKNIGKSIKNILRYHNGLVAKG